MRFFGRARAHQHQDENRRPRTVAAAVSALLVGGVAAAVSAPAAAVAAAPAPAASTVASADALWSRVDASPATAKAHAAGRQVQIHTDHGRVFTLNNKGMSSSLSAAPREFTAATATGARVIALPDPVRGFQHFRVVDAPIMAPALAAKHPNIHTYSGVGVEDPYADVRIAMTPIGFSASVRSEHGSWYVDTLYHLDNGTYVSYYAKNLVNTHGNYVEREASDAAAAPMAHANTVQPHVTSGATLRVYRLALVSDPTFAAYWGAANVTAGKVLLMVRANQIYEQEFSYRLDLVANNDALNFNTPARAYEPNGPCGASACYTQSQLASCGNGTLTRNRYVVGQLIGAANYDIGHISVGQDGGGIAALGVIGGSNKAQGCTGIPQPDGDYYVTDYLTHEMGHQFAMDHPFNGTQYNCSTSNRNGATSYEPGSGSSIMAYAGICRQDDLQPHSDAYFSPISYQETQAYVTSTLANLTETQTGVLTHFGGGNEVQTVTFGPGYVSSFSVDHGPLTINSATSVSGTGASEVGNLVTINTGSAHFLHVGDVVTISGVGVAGYNGTWTVTATPYSTAFQFTNPTAGLAASGSGTVTPPTFGATESGTTATITTTTPHGLSVGSQVNISGMTASGYNGAWTVTAVPSPTTFTYTAATAGLANSGNGSVLSFAPFQFGYNGQDSAVIGGTGAPFTTTGIAAAINAIAGFPGTVTVGSLATTGFTLTFTGASAGVDVPNLTIDNLSCGGCFGAVDETNHGGAADSYTLSYNGGPDSAVITPASTTANIQAALQGVSEVQTVALSGFTANGASYTLTYNGQTTAPIVRGTNSTAAGVLAALTALPNWVPGSSVSVGTTSDSGYTVTFNGQGDVPSLSVNGAGSVNGSVTETVKGTSGILPTGATATVSASSFNSASTAAGIQVSFGGTLAANFGSAGVKMLSFTNLTSGASGSFAETTRGGPAPYNAGYTQVATGNNVPTAVVTPQSSYTIPYRTPFALTGGGTDADGEAVTYMWEQFDRGPTSTSGGTALVSSNKTNGPLFREFGTALNSGVYDVHKYGSCAPGGDTNGENCAGTSPTRVFPDMTQVLADNTNAATGVCPDTIPSSPLPLPQSLKDCLSEWLPTSVYAGPMHFILTTRDNHPGAGGRTESGLVTVNLASGSTAFRVTSQASTTSYAGGSTQQVTWNVGGTDQAPISTSSMNILLSTDGGNTFPTTVAANVPNAGSANVTLPDVSTSQARLEVVPADGNIYFDVNHANFTILGSQTITLDPIADHTFGDSDFSVNATSSSGLPVTYTVGLNDNCTISGSSVHITGAGSCTVTATQPGDATHQAAAPVSQTFAIAKAAQTITFNSLSDHTYGDADFDVSATVSSGLTPTFSVGANDDCTISGTTVSITGAGSCTVTAHRAASANYLAADDVAQTFAIARADQSIAFVVGDHTFGDPDFSVSATATSGLTVAFSVDSGRCTVSGSTVHIVGGGSCTVRASQAGGANYKPAPDVVRTFNINRENQTITFGSLPDKTYGDSDFPVSASASSGLAVSFAAAGSCTVSGGNVHLTGAGSCVVTASQAGNSDYLGASDVQQTFAIAQSGQSISFATIPTKSFTSPDFTLGATATSGLAVQYSASGGCSVTGATVHVTAAGTCTIAADQPGDTDYLAATTVRRTFAINKGNQTIDFPALPNTKYGVDVTPAATATSGLPVGYLVTDGPCTFVNGQIHATSIGTCKITAYQHGDANWNLALSKVKPIKFVAAPTTTTLVSNSPVPFNGTIQLTATVSSAASMPAGGSVQFLKDDGTLLGQVALAGGTAELDTAAPSVPGNVKVRAKYVPAPGANWLGSQSALIKVRIS